MLRPHRSHSQLKAYQWCGHQYYLTRILHKPEDPSVWSPAGTAFHQATEFIDNNTFGWRRADWEACEIEVFLSECQDKFTDIFEALLDELRVKFPDESTWRAAGKATKAKPEKENVAFWREYGRELVGKYLLWRVSTADTWEIASVNGAPGIEVEVTSPLGGVPMKGYVDRVLRSLVDGRLLVMDLKSGSRVPSSPMQLATYSIQLEEKMGEPVLWGGFYMARSGVMTEPINLAPFTAQLLGKVYSDLDRSIEAGIFMPVVDDHCKGCAVRRFCVYQGGVEDAAA